MVTFVKGECSWTEEHKKRHSEYMKALWKDLDYRQSMLVKIRDPEFQKRMSEIRKKIPMPWLKNLPPMTEDHKAKLKEGIARYWTEERRKDWGLNNPAKRPEVRAKISRNLKTFNKNNPTFMKTIANSPECLKKRSINTKRQWETKREIMVEGLRKAAQRPEIKAKKVEARKEFFRQHPERKEYYKHIDHSHTKTPEFRLARSIAQKARIAKNQEYRKVLIDRFIKAGRDSAVERGKKLKLMYAEGKIKKKFGLENCMARPEVVRKVFSIINAKPNGLEKWFIDLFQSNHLPIEYIGDAQLILKTRKGSRLPDFKITGTNKLIEVGSTRWHSEAEFKERVELYSEIGFECKTILLENCKPSILDSKQDTILDEIKAFIQ